MLQSQADKPQRGSPSSTWKEQQTPVMSTVDQVRVVVCGCKLSSAGLHNEASPPPKRDKQAIQASNRVETHTVQCVVCTCVMNSCAHVAKQCNLPTCSCYSCCAGCRALPHARCQVRHHHRLLDNVAGQVRAWYHVEKRKSCALGRELRKVMVRRRTCPHALPLVPCTSAGASAMRHSTQVLGSAQRDYTRGASPNGQQAGPLWVPPPTKCVRKQLGR